MKAFRLLLAVISGGFALSTRAADEKTIPTMPAEVTLTSGRVLRDVQVVRWEKDRVVLKYAGGIDPIAFSLIKSVGLDDLRAMRAAALNTLPKAAALPKEQRLTGQIFITTKGAGAYKFSGAFVALYPQSALDSVKAKVEDEFKSAKAGSRAFGLEQEEAERIRFESWLRGCREITPVATTTTDANGEYFLKYSTTEPVFIFCPTTRLVNGRNEYNIWAVRVGSGDRLDLNNINGQ